MFYCYFLFAISSRTWASNCKFLHGDIDVFGDIANIANFASAIFCFGKSGKSGKTFAISAISASAFFTC